MKTSPPKVTVVVVNYNHERFVDRALKSVLDQTYSNIEFIITDDASTDSSPDLISDFIERHERKTQFIQNETNCGLPATLNLARQQLNGDYVAFMSADDWMAEDRIALQVEALEVLGPEYALCYSDAYIADELGSVLSQTHLESNYPNWYRPSGGVFQELLERNFIPAPSVLLRRAALDVAGPYDESLSYEDYDMWLRLTREYLVAFVPAPLVYYRHVDNSMKRSFDPSVKAEEKLRILNKHRGFSAESDRKIRRRVRSYARFLYEMGYDPSTIRAYLKPHLNDPPMGMLINSVYYLCAVTGINGKVLGVLGKRFR